MQKKASLIATLLCVSQLIFSQSQTPVYLSQSIANANSKGFYRYLPADYATSTKNYPLIIWLHGAGQVGQGTTTDLPKVLEWGVPKIINEGGFPANFTVGDSSFSFVIISPQFMGWPSATNVGAIISYAKNNYRVDPARIYLMGISAGGGAVWDYASASTANSNNLAAIISFCGTTSPTQTLANRIAASNLPVWAFHNTYDGTVPVAYSRNWVNFINGYVPTPSPLAKLTEFPVQSNNAVTAHESWSLATLPSYKPAGINIYEWMLGYRKRTVTVNLPPSASAGQDQGIVLPASAVLDGSASTDQDGIIVSYRWRKISGPATHQFSDSTLASPTVSNLAQGAYQFELSVTDNMGATTTDAVVINAYASLPPGAQQRILIDVGSSNANGGTITTSPAINGNVWNNMTDARPGVRITNALTINNQLSGISLEVINRVDGTYSTGSTGLGNGNTAGIVSDYPASATTDHALIHKSATNGKWKIRGLQANKIYTVKFWGTRSNTTAARNAEIKRADDNVWKTYSATSNTNYNNAAVFNIAGKTEMEFDIRTKAGSDFSAINVLDIYYSSDTTITPPPPPVNLAPVSKAGIDTVLQLPADSVTLRGCSSSDPEGAVLKFKWRKISGPATYNLTTDTLCAVVVKALTAGVYGFELTVTDTAGLTGKDSVLITVNNLVSTNWPPQVTPLCNRPYKIVVVGSSTAFGTGANPIDSSWVRKFKAYLLIQNQQVQVINIATLGLTSWDVSPTGTTVPAPFTIDTMRNITKALSYNPDAIILSLPSNDAARGVATNDIHTNYLRITSLAQQANVPVWVTTTQPRDGLSAAERTLQMNLRDWINTTYGNKAVDYWTTVANTDGTINSFYAAGDGVHLNNYGHHVLFTRIVEEKIWDSICNRNNLAPVASAGNDTIVAGSSISLTLNAAGSYDPEGSSLGFSWRILNNTNGALNAAGSSQPVFSTSVSGNYAIELKVTDNMNRYGLDTINVLVYAPNQPPVAAAGSDILLVQIQDSIRLDGSASLDADGIIGKYKWIQVSGPAAIITNDSLVRPWVRLFATGNYIFSLTVTDDSLATDTDTIMLVVNAVPAANAGSDKSATLPAATASFNASASSDSDGTIVKYRWKTVNATAQVNISDTGAIETTAYFSVQGQYMLELMVTDNRGAVGRDTVLITVNPDPNIAPIANAGADQVITLPNNTASLNATTSTDNDGSISSYKWRRINTANNVIADSNAVITNAVFSAAGQYLFELTVTDNLGATGRDTVEITVNPDPNTVPVANAGADKSIQLPVNKVFLDGRSSYDAEAGIPQFNWQYVSGPSGSQLLTSSFDTTSVIFANPGTYIFKLTVTDEGGLQGTDNITVTVLPVPDVTKRIKVNIYGGVNPYTNTQWNNWNIAAGLTSPKFSYEDAVLSNVNVSITSSALVADNGATYAPAATACPPQVLRYTSANTSQRTLTFNGFSTSKQYSFQFYASRSNTGNSTVIIIGNRNDTISTSSNINDFASFTNISPDASGRIIVNVKTIGTWNYLSGFVITEEAPAAPVTSFARSFAPDAPGQTITEDNGSKEEFSITPNPAAEVVQLQIPPGLSGKYLLTIINMNGKIVLRKTGVKGNDLFTEKINIKDLQKGMYVLRLEMKDKYLSRIFVKL